MKSNIAVRLYRRIIFPHSKGEFLQSLPVTKAEILDVGCGNNSPAHIKSILPDCVYTGIDVSNYNQTKPNVADNYILTSEEGFAESISQMPNRFDAVISSHNLEHCNQREETLLSMLRSLKSGGAILSHLSLREQREFPFQRRYSELLRRQNPQRPAAFLHLVARNLKSKWYEGNLFNSCAQTLYSLFDWLVERAISRRKNKTDYYTWAYYGFQTIIWAEKVR